MSKNDEQRDYYVEFPGDNNIIDSCILNQNEKLKMKEQIISELLREISQIQELNRSNLEKNSQILPMVNDIITSSTEVNQINTLLKEIVTLNSRITLLSEINFDNKNDIITLSNALNENIFMQKTYFFEKETFDDSVYKNYKRLTKSYADMIISFKTNFSKLIDFYTNSKKCEKIIMVNVMNFMKFFEGKMEVFYKNFEKKYTKQKEKIIRLKKLILEKKFEFFSGFDVFKQLKKEIILFAEYKNEINKKISFLYECNTKLDLKSSNKPHQVQKMSKHKTSSNLILISKKESIERSKIVKLTSDNKKHEEDFSSLSNKRLDTDTTNTYDLKHNLNINTSIETNGITKTNTDDSFKSQYEDLTSRLFKLKINQKESYSSEDQHERALILIKKLEVYLDIKTTKLQPAALSYSKAINAKPYEVKKAVQNLNKNNISSDVTIKP